MCYAVCILIRIQFVFKRPFFLLCNQSRRMCVCLVWSGKKAYLKFKIVAEAVTAPSVLCLIHITLQIAGGSIDSATQSAVKIATDGMISYYPFFNGFGEFREGQWVYYSRSYAGKEVSGRSVGVLQQVICRRGSFKQVSGWASHGSSHWLHS